MQRKILEPKRKEVRGDWRKQCNDELCAFHHILVGCSEQIW